VVKRTIASQLRDLALYVAAGVVSVAAVILLSIYDTRKGVSPNPARVNWLMLGFVITVAFIMAIHEGWRLRRKRHFWLGLGLALIVDIACGVLVLWNAPQIPVFVWVAVYLNAIAIDQFMRWWLRDMDSVAHRALRGGPTKG
jgi:hypothetical protein